jgi:hypothetical protein
VPDDVELGDHVVKICWANSCHKDAVLRVVAGAGGPLPNGSPSATSGATPHASPTPRATATPRATPSAATSPSPTPTSNPCSTSTSGARLSESPSTVLAGVTNVTVSGQNFTPNASVTVRYYVGNSLKSQWSRTVACNGTFSVAFTPGPLDTGTAKVTAADSAGRNANVAFTIT